MSGGYGPGGYPGQGYDGQGYDGQGYDDDPSGRGRPRGGRQRGGRPRGLGRGDYGDQRYRPQDTGSRPGQYGGVPQYDQQRYDQQQRYDEWQGGYEQGEGDGSFLPGFGGRDDFGDGRYAQERGGRHDDYDQRGDDYYDQRGDDYYDQRGHDDYDQRGDDDYDQRYDDYYDQRGDRGDWRPDDRGPGARGPGADGPHPGFDDDWDDWDDRDRRPRKRVTRWFPRILVLAVVAVIVVGGLVGGLAVYHRYEARYHPPDYAGPGTGEVTFHVPNGATAFSLAPELYQLGVIASTRAFTNAAEASTSTAGLEAGYFQLHYHMRASLVYAALINPKNRVQTTVTIPEGERVSQVLTTLAKYSKIPLSKFEAAAKDTAALGLPSYAGTSVKLPATVPYGQLEGYLFPATYAITPHETALQILQAMVARFNVEAQQVNIQQAARAAGLTPGKLIIEASMVQAEAGVDSDMPKMARVILNREAKGMPDGFDSVVVYGLGIFDVNITPAQAAASGPYDNTQHPGLPPTPIDNPGNAAIQAVLHPASGDWLYFLGNGAGKPATFSVTCSLPGTCG